MRKFNIILCLLFIVLTFSTISATACRTTETNYNIKNRNYCCTLYSCRLGANDDPLLGSEITIITMDENDHGNLFSGGCAGSSCSISKVPFICGFKRDCDGIASILGAGDYCCISQFCTFKGSSCQLEKLEFGLSKKLFDALMGIAICLFVINVIIAIILAYKVCRKPLPRTNNYLIKDNTPGLNIFLPSQYEGGQGMTTDGHVIEQIPEKKVRARKTRRGRKGQGNNPGDAENMYNMQKQEGNPYIEGQQTQDYASGFMPEELGGDISGAQFQQTENMIGVQFGQNGQMPYQNQVNLNQNDPNQMNIQQMVNDDPLGMPQTEDINNGSIGN